MLDYLRKYVRSLGEDEQLRFKIAAVAFVLTLGAFLLAWHAVQTLKK